MIGPQERWIRRAEPVSAGSFIVGQDRFPRNEYNDGIKPEWEMDVGAR